jgi:hypothetical protein
MALHDAVPDPTADVTVNVSQVLRAAAIHAAYWHGLTEAGLPASVATDLACAYIHALGLGPARQHDEPPESPEGWRPT